MTLLKFFGLTYALSWLLWSLVAFVPVDTPLRTQLFLPGTFAPAIVALVLTSRAQGRAGVSALLERIVQWNVPLRWYVLALTYIGWVKLAAAIGERVTSGAWPAIAEQIPWILFILGALISTPFQTGEEIGWRGYALPRLTERFGLGGAAIVLGVIWAAWHLPLFFIAGTDTTGQSFPFYALTVTAISVPMAWLYARTGSLLLVMLMHAAVNNTPHFIAPPATGQVWTFHATRVQWLTAALLWVVAVVLLARMRHVTRRGTAVS